MRRFLVAITVLATTFAISTSAAASTPLAAPSKLKVVTVSQHWITVSWVNPKATPATKITGASVLMSDNAGKTWISIPNGIGTTIKVAATQKVDLFAASARNYLIKVAAITSKGFGKYSTPIKASTPSGPPFAPALAPDVSRGPNGGVEPSWFFAGDDGGSPITSYTISYRPVGASAWSTILLTENVESQGGYEFTNWPNGSSWEFMVVATNKLGTSPWMEIRTIKIAANGTITFTSKMSSKPFA